MDLKIPQGQLFFWAKYFGDWPVYPGHPMILACCTMLTYRKASDALASVKQGPSFNCIELVTNSTIPGAGGSCYLAVDLLEHIQSNWTRTTAWHKAKIEGWRQAVGHLGAEPRFRKAILFSRLQWDGISRGFDVAKKDAGVRQAAENERLFLELARKWDWN